MRLPACVSKDFSRIAKKVAVLLTLFAVGSLYASEGFEELVNQVRSGSNDVALMAYINASPVSYNLTVEEILYLNDLGVSAATIEAVVTHGKQLTGDAPAEVPDVSMPTETPPLPPPVIEASSSAPALAPQPAVTLEAISVVSETPALALATPTPFVDLSGGKATVPMAAMVVQAPVVTAPPIATPPSAMTDVSYFYQTLAPYGSWLNLDDVWCWQPTVMVVNREWRPYCERGHWVYTDCGWMWQSDYSWGWAPFHYGRWRQHARYGWIWMPDTVWGPAWVVWRGDNAAVGWAPLPPGSVFENSGGFSYHGQRAHAGYDFELNADAYIFVKSAHFCESALSRHRMQHAEVMRVFNTATIIQNSYTMTDNRIVNHGPPVVRIAGATNRKIQPVRILDQAVPSGHPLQMGILANQTVSVFRPHLNPTARETPETVAMRSRALVAAHRAAEVRHDVRIPGRSAAGVSQTALPGYANGAIVRSFSERGSSSRGTADRVSVRPSPPPVSGHGAAAERNRANLQRQAEAAARQHQAETVVARQRQTEEAATRQQQDAARRAKDTVQQQEAQRRVQDAARKQSEQRRIQDAARQQETQRRADDLAKQQETQRQAQEKETARQQAVQRRAQDTQRQQEAEAQRRLLQTQRQAEEASARQQETAVHQQAEAQRRTQDASRQDTSSERAQRPPPQTKTTPNAIQDYGNGQLTGAASVRGAVSRNKANRSGSDGDGVK